MNKISVIERPGRPQPAINSPFLKGYLCWNTEYFQVTRGKLHRVSFP